MHIRLIATLLALSTVVLLPRAASADLLMVRVPHLPSMLTSPTPSVLTTGASVNASSATSPTAAGAASPALVPVDNGFLARVARLLDGLRPPVSGNPGDSAWRNPSLRDPARDRDATSFGIRSARLSPSGLAFAGAGVGAGAAQLVDLGSVAKSVPVKVAPTMCQGGGGISLKLPW